MSAANTSASVADIVFILHPTPLNHSHRCAGQAVETFRSASNAHWRRLGTTGRPPQRTKFKQLFLVGLRYALPCLTLISGSSPPFDYRPICAQFEDHLMSLRRLVITLRAPSPAVRLGRSFISGCRVQKPLRRASACQSFLCVTSACFPPGSAADLRSLRSLHCL